MLFTFPSWYSFTIGLVLYLALESGLPSFPRAFACPVVLRNRLRMTWVSYTRLSQSMVCYSKQFYYPYHSHIVCPPTLLARCTRESRFRIEDLGRLYFFEICNLAIFGLKSPVQRTSSLGSSAFARRYLRNHICFLFLRLIRCFSSPTYLPDSYTPINRGFDHQVHQFTLAGLPHSETAGSYG